MAGSGEECLLTHTKSRGDEEEHERNDCCRETEKEKRRRTVAADTHRWKKYRRALLLGASGCMNELQTLSQLGSISEKPMMEMEPFPFYQEDAIGTGATATAMEELFSWDFRGLSDLVSPAFDPSPPPSEEDMLLWGMPPVEEYECPTSLSLPPPPPLLSTPGMELLQCWAMSPGTQSAVPAPPLLDQLPPMQGVRRSAFEGYVRGRCYRDCRRSGGENIHKRVMECLRRIPMGKEEKKAAEGSRCFRHMIRERRRRERLSQSYSDLHSMIVPRPKANKNAIVLSAVAYVRELKSTRDALQRRHQELRASLGEPGGGGGRLEGATIKLRVGNPTSSVDSMIAALRQLKGMDVRARSIQSCADGQELSAVIDAETNKLARKEVEKAVEGALVETERKLRSSFGACER